MSTYRPASLGGGGGAGPGGITVLSGQYQISGIYPASGIYQISGIYPTSGLFQLSGAGSVGSSGSSMVGAIAQFSGNGSGTVFLITHGIGTTPTKFTAIPNSLDAIGDYRVEASGNTLSVIYTTARPSGNSNISLAWMADTNTVSGGILGSNILVGGQASFSGDTSGTTFLITHNIGVIPSRYGVVPTTVDAMGDYRVEASGNTLSVIYTAARPSGASNIGLVWFADTNNVSGGPANPLNVGALNVSGTATFSGALIAQSGNFQNLSVLNSQVVSGIFTGQSGSFGQLVVQSGIRIPMVAPASPASGSIFFDISGGLQMYNGTRFIRGRQQSQTTYFIYVSGSNFVMERQYDGSIFATSASEIGAMMVSGIAESSGHAIIFDIKERTANNAYPVSTPIEVPTRFPVHIRGPTTSVRGAAGAMLQTAAGFPSGRSFIEAVTSGAASQAPYLRVENITFYDINYASGKNVGGIDYECSNTNVFNSLYLRNVSFFKIPRGLTIRGVTNDCTIDGIFFMDSADAAFSGQYDIKLAPANIDKPGFLTFRDVFITHAGFQEVALDLDCKYCGFYNTRVDGTQYGEACMIVRGGYNNEFYSTTLLDLNTSGASNKAAILMKGIDTSGNTGLTNGAGSNNKFYGCNVGAYPVMVKLESGSNRNSFELAYFGKNVIVDDIQGAFNTFVIKEGNALSGGGAWTSTKTIISGNNKIIDQRFGAENNGIFLDSGNASKTAYFIPHGLFANPASGLINVNAGSPQARANFDVSGNASGITVTYPVAPASGDVRLYWEASIY